MELKKECRLRKRKRDDRINQFIIESYDEHRLNIGLVISPNNVTGTLLRRTWVELKEVK